MQLSLLITFVLSLAAIVLFHVPTVRAAKGDDPDNAQLTKATQKGNAKKASELYKKAKEATGDQEMKATYTKTIQDFEAKRKAILATYTRTSQEFEEKWNAFLATYTRTSQDFEEGNADDPDNAQLTKATQKVAEAVEAVQEGNAKVTEAVKENDDNA
eukprot:GHVS01066127.1.p1 GENE.GHVS01066127.1~~GHVS01066127.1.p1  ORF type:complete len:158 (+),score=16.01 GHVS01066127.1:84-557(+)